MRKRRYEILLPFTYNDGRPVENKKFSLTRRQLMAEFGALSFHPDRISGWWSDGSQKFEDELAKIVIDVEDSDSSDDFFVEFKNTLLSRFQQIEIYVIWFEIERV